ncbi:MAG: dockerin type I repeat-containing protein, partial [Oscillospiraceae bacterium]|nr:dockerin type I repeat-containing protein [Oscillospiraceae bacterium]
IPALGHSYGEPTYTWNEGCSVCSAVSVCEHDDSHTIEEEGKISSRKEGKSIIYTAKFSKLVFSAQSVKVTGETVEELPAPAIGDANGDGDVTLSDAVLLTQLIGEDESMQAQTAQALDADLDYDGDGAVTLVDLRAILKQLGK